MKRPSITLFTLITTILFFSCGKDDIPVTDSQKILFECYYINYAWGYNHHGFFIDNDGKIMNYSQHGNYSDENWNFPDNEGNISKQDLTENLQKTSINETSIDKSTLKIYSDKISLVKNDDYTEYHAMCDAGANVCVCYLYNENTGMYKQLILSQEGDWVIINNNEYAKQISDWLKSINLKITSNEN